MSNFSTVSRSRLLFLISVLAASSAMAGVTDLADTPLASGTSGQAKPNVFFILDDSGSMAWKYMPDGMSSSTIGYRNYQCNTIYYNPSITYEIPKAYDGVFLNNASQTAFSAAYVNGYDSYMGSNSGTTNLSSAFSADDSESGRAAYYWVLNNPTTDTSATSLVPLNTRCNHSTASVTSSTTGVCCDTRADKNYTSTCSNPTYPTNSPATCAGGKTLVWKKVLVSSTSGPGSTDERQNFANWYSYYRTRMMMMKAASARAFFQIGDNYRVGFMTIHPGTFDQDTGNVSGSSVDSDKFLKISDFNSTHRSNWFSKLFSQTTNSSTPLRPALAVAGNYYAGKNTGYSQGMIPTTADDPVQYSCQQNFTILTTDGYWNGGDGRQLTNTLSVGNQDGVISELDAYNPAGSKLAMSPRPIYDGASTTYVWNTASNAYRTVTCTMPTVTVQERTRQYQACTSTNSLKTRISSNSGSTWSDWYFVSSCTVDNSGTSRRQCATGGTGKQTRTSSNSGATWTAWTDLTDSYSVCVVDNSGSSRRQCRDAYKCESNATWANGQCTGTDDTTLPLCRSSVGAWANNPAASCAAAGLPTAQDGAGVAVECQEVPDSGYKIEYQATVTSKTFPGPNQSGTQIGATATSVAPWAEYSACQATVPAQPANGAVTGAGLPDPPANCTSGLQEWPCETLSSSGGSSNSLADVAQYYYKTDLRTNSLGNCTGGLGGSLSVCDNNVPSSGTGAEDDRANWQHMTTFTMGLGLSGTLSFSPTYKTDSSGTFADIRAGTVNWPVPSANSASALDDLWHAAVNGRGLYFSASNPDAVVNSLQSALSGIAARVASAAAAATSNLEPVAGDNFAYTAKYVTQKWTGELEAREIDLDSGVVGATPIWSAQTKLDALAKGACDNRNIKLFRAGATNNLVDFKWNTYACNGTGSPTGAAVTTLDTAEQDNFGSAQVAQLSHYPNMSTGVAPSTVDQRSLAAGANLVNYLRGQRGKEGFDSGPPATVDNANKLYRARDGVLGDIINAQPVFVKAPFAEYSDPGYTNFKTNNSNRTPVVYVAANDGMLHAFYAGTSATDPNGGVEAWAFIPTMALPNMYKLASENYANQHTYLVDGTPTAADVFDKNASADCALATPSTPENCWRTILVGGLNKGGKGYYALDITDPATPKALWEFKNGTTCISVNATTKVPTVDSYTDCHIGYTYNNPLVGKLADGTWAVFVTSGYNNDNGQGYLYVLNAMTGKILYRIDTGVGTAGDPSGLNHINAWVNSPLTNNTIDRVYGVDLKGNIWRFDVNDTIVPSGREATRVAQVVDPAGVPQPITIKPELAEISGQPFVYVATGRYLGTTDVADSQTQTLWGIKDPMGATAVTNLRTTLGERTIVNQGSGNTATRTITASSCATGEGWFVDLPDDGERVNIDMKLQLGTLIFASNVPLSDACSIGGYSWLNFISHTTGCAVSGGTVGMKLVGDSGTNSLAVGVNVVRLPSGKTVVIATTSAAEQITLEPSIAGDPSDGKRVSWRELLQ